MEVVTGLDDGTNELYVDGTYTGASNDNVDEGTWDDGGFGAVCHTTNMPGTGYDTWGCNYGRAFATDSVTTRPVWVVTGCDWGFATGGRSFDPTPRPGLDAYQDCAINNGALGNLGRQQQFPMPRRPAWKISVIMRILTMPFFSWSA